VNWKRVWTGTLLAGLVALAMDASFLYFLGHWMIRAFLIDAAADLLPSLVMGFALTWLYVLARPRLGPGPRTALTTATVAWVLMIGFQLVNVRLWRSPAILIQAVLIWIKCALATYVAGWQYIERAP
jgi:hypothetical protein